MNKIERLINLTAVLLDSGKPLTIEQLRETVYRDQSRSPNALRRMFERDKEELRDMGIDIEVVPGVWEDEAGYTISKDTYYLPHLDLVPEEQVALRMVSRLFLGSGTPFSGPAQSALMKLAFDQGAEAPEEVPHIYWVESHPERELLTAILDGIVRRKLLTLSYRSLDAGEPTVREIEPYGLFNRRGYWYLIGLCHLRNEIRCFKLDRVASRIEVNPRKPRTPDFEVPPGFDIQKEASWEWPLPKEEEDVVARVVFSPRLAFAHSTGSANVLSTRRFKDGRLEATYEVADPEQFIDWVLEFGVDARIVAPRELIDMAKERLAGILEVVKGQ